jgi:hypothetical protein
MKRTGWIFAAAAVAGIVALVAPAVGQGKAEGRALRWSRFRGGPTITSYNFSVVHAGSRVTRGFRLRSASTTKSGKLAIRLTGSSAFSITSDHCTRKSIAQKLSCWVGIGYAPRQGESGDSATLRATGEEVAAASLSLTGGNPSPPGHVYWVNRGDGTVNEVPIGGGPVTTLAHPGYSGTVSVAVDSSHV